MMNRREARLLVGIEAFIAPEFVRGKTIEVLHQLGKQSRTLGNNTSVSPAEELDDRQMRSPNVMRLANHRDQILGVVFT
jgi:hypothetical protein